MDNGELLFTEELDVSATTIPADRYAEVKNFFEEVAGAEQAPLVLVRNEAEVGNLAIARVLLHLENRFNLHGDVAWQHHPYSRACMTPGFSKHFHQNIRNRFFITCGCFPNGRRVHHAQQLHHAPHPAQVTIKRFLGGREQLQPDKSRVLIRFFHRHLATTRPVFIWLSP